MRYSLLVHCSQYRWASYLLRRRAVFIDYLVTYLLIVTASCPGTFSPFCRTSASILIFLRIAFTIIVSYSIAISFREKVKYVAFTIVVTFNLFYLFEAQLLTKIIIIRRSVTPTSTSWITRFVQTYNIHDSTPIILVWSRFVALL